MFGRLILLALALVYLDLFLWVTQTLMRPCDQVNMVGILGLHCKGTTKLQSSQWLAPMGVPVNSPEDGLPHAALSNYGEVIDAPFRLPTESYQTFSRLLPGLEQAGILHSF
eukprot:g31087.t1